MHIYFSFLQVPTIFSFRLSFLWFQVTFHNFYEWVFSLLSHQPLPFSLKPTSTLNPDFWFLAIADLCLYLFTLQNYLFLLFNFIYFLHFIILNYSMDFLDLLYLWTLSSSISFLFQQVPLLFLVIMIFLLSFLALGILHLIYQSFLLISVANFLFFNHPLKHRIFWVKEKCIYYYFAFENVPPAFLFFA